MILMLALSDSKLLATCCLIWQCNSIR